MHRLIVGLITLAAAYWLGQVINAQFANLAKRLEVPCQINTDC